ncbi:Imm1 family immunity protein [Streptomyces sp. NPDC089915]|uniref:Imm1 family immunity protein n=1 Tax=Streptomyces sp. NPDC089915 TaxID=3155186 RepID=UPI00343FFD0C
MIVEASIDGETLRVDSEGEIVKLIARIMSDLKSELPAAVGIDPGTTASMHVFDVSNEAQMPPYAENSIRVGVNKATGYGGIVWWGPEVDGQPNEHYWVTDNDSPPDFDPRVTSDQCFPLWYDRRSAIAVTDVEQALWEFCTSKGMRPTAVRWVPADPSGQRL